MHHTSTYTILTLQERKHSSGFKGSLTRCRIHSKESHGLHVQPRFWRVKTDGNISSALPKTFWAVRYECFMLIFFVQGI